ncbi:MAG: DUF2723 domain-containing protein [Ignavibacteriales bacterium]|nr:MAG: DUF2723 domain-containing protein [Ignavibacteriales bacterium]
MNNKLVHRIFAVFVFIISFIQYFLTVQPSVSFWDCGEFIAAGYSLQVPHPPGAPLFLLLGRLFSMLPIGENIAFRVNMISVLSSALSVVFVYLVAVKLIENFRDKKSESLLDRIVNYVAAAVGALSLSFSDTFWFNGVEAEVYAASTFLFALITWLMMLWNEKADEPDNEKYLIMIAYLVGLSTGVHLMAVLAMVPVVMVVVFRKYVDDEEALKKTGYIFLGHAVVLLLIALALWGGQKIAQPPAPEEYQAFDSRFKWIMVGISVVVMAAFWKKLFNRNSFYIPLIVGGIALAFTYPGVVKMLPGLIKNVGGDNITVDILVIVVLFAILGGGIYWSVKNNKPTLNLVFTSMLFVILGFTTYAMVIIRANQQPPMNENEPNDFTELVSYLNREQYGDFPTFKRRFTAEAHQTGVYTNYSSDLEFFWKYQMDHMFNRYLAWNYIGRVGWNQDDGVNWKQLYGIPFFIGLFGIYFHFRKDWKMASVFMVMFIFMGYLTAFYQNQQEPQPRERDYFYVGAFFVYSVWIALGVRGLADLVKESIKNKSAAQFAVYGILLFSVVFVPINMARTNWASHDRSDNYVPWDYSYNLLQSCAPNAILFTNGDNDTFPLWYLQDVEGVRRDVRIANLSLLNTPWYIKQLKHTEPYGAMKVAINYTDAMIETIEPVRWEPQIVSVPVSPQVLNDYTVKDASIESPVPTSFVEKYGSIDSSIVKTGRLAWRMSNTLSYGEVKAIRVQDLMVKDIVEANNWQRPIYFAVTCADDSKIGLQDYLIMEGLAYRLIPVKRKPNQEFLNEDIMKKQLYVDKPSFSKTYKPGFNFRGLNDKSMFFDDNHERLMQNYRSSYMRLAVYYLYNEKNNKESVRALDEMEKRIPRDVVKMPYGLEFELSSMYFTAGAIDKYTKMARDIEKIALKQLADNPDSFTDYYNPYRVLSEIYSNLKEYKKGINLFLPLQRRYPDDPGIKAELERFKRMAALQDSVTKK